VPADDDDRRRLIIQRGLFGGVRISICVEQFPAYIAARAVTIGSSSTRLSGSSSKGCPVLVRQADSRMNRQHQSSAIQTSLPSMLPHVKNRLELGPVEGQDVTYRFEQARHQRDHALRLRRRFESRLLAGAQTTGSQTLGGTRPGPIANAGRKPSSTTMSMQSSEVAPESRKLSS
jgi:hypothetical protein